MPRTASCASGWSAEKSCPIISRTIRSITPGPRRRRKGMLAKGNRSPAVREACKKYGGFYLASIGGTAANLAEHCIKKVECLEYAELGMEAIWRIEVENFPAFIVIDDKGNDFFKELNLG